MGPDGQIKLRRAVAALSAPGATVDLARWSQLADVTTSRAGFLLAGSVETARKAMLLESQYASDLSPRESVRELLLFAISDEYFDLRGSIGVSVETAMQRGR
jgi:hypothetical protein